MELAQEDGSKDAAQKAADEGGADSGAAPPEQGEADAGQNSSPPALAQVVGDTDAQRKAAEAAERAKLLAEFDEDAAHERVAEVAVDAGEEGEPGVGRRPAEEGPQGEADGAKEGAEAGVVEESAAADMGGEVPPGSAAAGGEEEETSPPPAAPEQGSPSKSPLLARLQASARKVSLMSSATSRISEFAEFNHHSDSRAMQRQSYDAEKQKRSKEKEAAEQRRKEKQAEEEEIQRKLEYEKNRIRATAYKVGPPDKLKKVKPRDGTTQKPF
jgi:hypothetical protein